MDAVVEVVVVVGMVELVAVGGGLEGGAAGAREGGAEEEEEEEGEGEAEAEAEAEAEEAHRR